MPDTIRIIISSPFWEFTFSDCITLLAVIVALGIGVWSMIHAQGLQNRALKHVLLNEVIDWAISVSAKAEDLRITDILLFPDLHWYEEWVILSEKTIGIVDMADKIDNDLKQDVKNGVDKFKAIDNSIKVDEQDMSDDEIKVMYEINKSSIKDINLFKDCINACNTILVTAQNVKVKNLR